MFFRDQVAKGNELAEKSIFSSSEIEKISKHAGEDCSDWIYTFREKINEIIEELNQIKKDKYEAKTQ